MLDRRFRFGRGRAFAVYAMAYTTGRFWIEGIRIDPAQQVLGVRLNQWTAAVVFLAAAIYFAATRVRGTSADDADRVEHPAINPTYDATDPAPLRDDAQDEAAATHPAESPPPKVPPHSERSGS